MIFFSCWKKTNKGGDDKLDEGDDVDDVELEGEDINEDKTR